MKKVCIIGAGISGLSCAITLERHGIIPDIYEQFKEDYQERNPFINCLLQLMNRPLLDPLIEIEKQFDISISPINVLDRIIMLSPNNFAQAKGSLGYIFERGNSPFSIDEQLKKQLNTKIRFNSRADYREMSKTYKRVVVATGFIEAAKELGCWRDFFRSWVRGAIVTGDFDPTTWVAWFNKSYANNGYAYLGPFSSKKASLVLIASDVQEKEIESKWQEFLKVEQLNYREKQSFRLEHIAGFCYPREIGNILLVGNTAGCMESLLGFGIYSSIASGVMAARAIINNTSYENEVAVLNKKLLDSYRIRKVFNMCTNSGYDRLLGTLNIPAINHAVYNTNFDVLGILSKTFSPFIKTNL